MLLKCSTCKDFKEEEYFCNKRSSSYKHRNFRSSHCKECSNALNKERTLKGLNRKYAKENREKFNFYNSNWRNKNKEAHNAIQRKARKKAAYNLTDSYIKRIIRENGFKIQNVPKELIQAVRLNITIKRKLNERTIRSCNS